RQLVAAVAQRRAPVELGGDAIALLPAPAQVVDRVEFAALEFRLDRNALRIEHQRDIAVCIGAFPIAIEVREVLLDEELLVAEVALLENRAVAVERVSVEIPVVGVGGEPGALGQLEGAFEN